MAARFLGKTVLAELVPLRAGGRPVLEQYEPLRSILAARFGAAAADLFAEPIVTWGGEASGSVSWYAEAIGEAEPLRALPAERRERLEAGLRDTLARLSPVLEEPDAGPLLLAALVLASPDGIRAVDLRDGDGDVAAQGHEHAAGCGCVRRAGGAIGRQRLARRAEIQ